MKKVIYILASVALTFSMMSCNNDEDPIFDDSAANRLDKAQSDYAKVLTDRGGKWLMEYFSNEEEPGYPFVLEFKKSGEVTMTTNNKWMTPRDVTASASSLWQMKSDDGVVLSFDTYNPLLHIFTDPENYKDPDSGNAQDDSAIDHTGNGHLGDYEFVVINVSDDENTVRLKGKKRGYYIYLRRLDESTDPVAYIDKCIEIGKTLFSQQVKRVFLTMGDNGERFVVSNNKGIITAYPEKGDNITQSSTASSIITPQGLRFMTELKVKRLTDVADSISVQSFILQPDGSLLCDDENDKTSTINVGSLSEHFDYAGYNWQIDLSNLSGVFKTCLDGTTDEIKRAANGTVQYYTFKINSDQSVTLLMRVRFRRGSQNVNQNLCYDFDAKVDGDAIKLTYTGADEVGQSYIGSIPSMKQLLDKISASVVTFSADNYLSTVNMTMKLSDTDYCGIRLQ